MLGTICTRILDALWAELRRPLVIVETGTAYIMTLEQGEKDLRERSTIAIALWVERHPGSVFYSVDISAEHQRVCFETMKKLGIPQQGIYLYTGFGPKALQEATTNFDFVLLDADSGGQTTLGEFEAVKGKMNPRSVVVIDDAFKPLDVNKAQFVIPTLNRSRIFNCKNQAVAISFGAEGILCSTYPKL